MTADAAGQMGTTALDEMTDDEIIGERVVLAMWRKRKSQAELAAELGVHQSSLSNKLRGKRPFFAREIGAVAAALDVDPAWLLGYEKSPHPEGEGGPHAGKETSLLSGSNRPPFAYKASRSKSKNRRTPCDVIQLDLHRKRA